MDGLNHEVAPKKLELRYEPAQKAYAAANALSRLRLGVKSGAEEPLAKWLTAQLRGQ